MKQQKDWEGITTFCSYEQADQTVYKQLTIHLSQLKRNGLIKEWSEQQILAGADRVQEIDHAIRSARLILLLISANFLASDTCYQTEMQQALERHKRGEAIVIPIIVSPCDWQHSPFAYLQYLPRNKHPITSWDNQDEAFQQVIEEMRKVIEEMFHTSTYVPAIHQRFEAHSSHLWNVPKRNPFFTGRENILTQLHGELKDQRTVALIQPLAISGLGGIGKTQLAVEYAYRYQHEYTAIFWFNAATMEGLRSEYVQLADFLQLSGRNTHDQDTIIMIVKRWFEQGKNWLLILDNADDIPLIHYFLPNIYLSSGHVLLTTRAQAGGVIAQHVPVERMPQNEGSLLLLRRAKIVPVGASLDHVSKEDHIQADAIFAEMDGLPLALDQAGAYIEETACGLSGYLTRYQRQRKKLLEKQSFLSPDYPKTVATTWSLSFDHIEQLNPAAADLLRVCSFLDPDAIPEEFILLGAHKLGGILKTISHDPHQLNEAIRAILRYSLIQRDSKKNMLSIHRLVQAVFQDNMDRKTQRQWAKRLIQAFHAAFPPSTPTTWTLCQRLLLQALVCAKLIDKYAFTFDAATDLLERIIDHVSEMRLTEEDEPLRYQLWTIREKTLGEEHEKTLNSLHQLAWMSYERGKYEHAELLYQRVLATLQKDEGKNKFFIGHVLHNLGWIATDQKKYEQAESLYLQSLAISKQAPETEMWRLAHSLWPLARLYTLQNKYEQAEPLYKQSLEIYEKVYEKNLYTGVEIPEVLQGLAKLYDLIGENAKIEPLLQRALVITEQVHGLEHPHLLNVLYDLAQFYFDVDDHEKMEASLQRTLNIRKQRLEPLPPSKYLVEITQMYEDLANFYKNLEMFEKAEPFYVEALAIREQVLGSEHIDTVDSLHGLAWCYTNQSKYEHAQPLLEQALTARQRILGQEHRGVAQSYMTLGWFYLRQNKLEQAKLFLQQALQIYTQIPEDECIAECASFLGDVYADLDEYEEAETMYKRVLHTWEQTKGFDAPEVTPTLKKLAQLYAQQGKYEQTEPLYIRALRIQEQVLGLEHPDVASTLHDLANVYYNHGKYEQAEPVYVQALAIREQQLELEHLDIAMNLADLADLYYSQEKYEQAEPLYIRALRIQEQVLGLEHPDVASTLHDLANVYYEQRKYEQAEPLYKRVITLDPDQPTAYLDQGYVYLHLQKIEQARANFATYATLQPEDVNAAWMVIWMAFGKEAPAPEIVELLEKIALIGPESDEACTCRGVALGLQGKHAEGLVELEHALQLKAEGQDAWFWKGVMCASLGDNMAAVEVIERALHNNLPPFLLTPLFWLKHKNLPFYQEYAEPLLKRYGLA